MKTSEINRIKTIDKADNIPFKMISVFTKLREKSLLARIAVLTAIVALALAISLPPAWMIGGQFAMLAAMTAAAACLCGGVLALAISGLFRDPAQAFVGVLLGMFADMGVPLAVAVACHLGGGELSRSGVIFYLLIFFPITLAVKTVLSLPKMTVPLENGQAS